MLFSISCNTSLSSVVRSNLGWCLTPVPAGIVGLERGGAGLLEGKEK